MYMKEITRLILHIILKKNSRNLDLIIIDPINLISKKEKE